MALWNPPVGIQNPEDLRHPRPHSAQPQTARLTAPPIVLSQRPRADLVDGRRATARYAR